MNRYVKISAALAAFALLLVVMGLSTQGTVNALTLSPGNNWVCATSTPEGDSECTFEDATFTLTNNTGADLTDIKITNTNLRTGSAGSTITVAETVAGEGAPTPIANGDTINFLVMDVGTIPEAAVIDDQDTTIDETDTCAERVASANDAISTYQGCIKGFNGNTISVSYAVPGGSLAQSVQVQVDTVKPSLIPLSPAPGTVVKGRTNVAFSAEFTDSGSAYSTATPTPSSSPKQIDDFVSGLLGATDFANVAENGAIRLVVAGNVVDLEPGNFEKLDGGWKVSVTINSSDIQAISTNVPWYWETSDRAGNLQRTSTSIKSKATSDAANDANRTIIDSLFSVDVGDVSVNMFDTTKVRVTLESETSKSQTVDAYTPADGSLAVEAPFFADADDESGYQCAFAAEEDNLDTPDVDETTLTEACEVGTGTSYEILKTNLITVDSAAPVLGDVTTGHAWSSVSMKNSTGLKAKATSIRVDFTDGGKLVNNNPAGEGSGLDADSVTPAAFSVAGNSVSSVLVVDEDSPRAPRVSLVVYLTLGEALGSSETPAVTLNSGMVADKAGNTASGTTKSSKNVIDGLGPNLTLAKSAPLSNDKVTITITSDEQLGDVPDQQTKKVTTTSGGLADDALTLSGSDAVAAKTALSYSFVVDKDNLGDAAASKFNVYVTAIDTQSGANEGAAGDEDNANDADAVTFVLDQKLNNGVDPIVKVAGNENVEADETMAKLDNVEQTDPMIVTVDFEQEGKEYMGDGQKTVELTSAKLKFTAPDGAVTNRTFNLTTEVSSPDNIKFTIPLLNAKIGNYELEVKARDQAGNVRLIDNRASPASAMKADWDVIAPSPVDIKLSPGWNLVSLPFQPANPAINSVINANHPADIVMTFDNASQVWLVSRRDAETGDFVGDIPVMTASTAYFIRTENFQAIRMLRPPLATAAAAPPPPPAITVVEGWNLVPIVSNDIPTPEAIAADDYFGTLGGNSSNAGWLKALSFNTLVRTWFSVTPGETIVLEYGETNPCTGETLDPDDVKDGSEPCQVVSATTTYSDRSDNDNNMIPDQVAIDAGTADAMMDNPDDTDGNEDTFDGNDKVTIRAPVTVGKGYWLYATTGGVIIP